MAYSPPYAPRAYNPYYEPPPRRFGTSPMEFVHITVAMLALAAVLGIVIEKSSGFSHIKKNLPFPARIAAALLISLFGFVFHELGHKFTAQHFGHWSEFRANWFALVAALAIALWLHLPIAAPGATWHTAQTKREQGKISAMGPLVNYAVAVIALAVAFFVGKATVTHELATVVVGFSTILALFNLIPIGPLDGRKIIAWNPIIWTVMVALGVGLVIQNLAFFMPTP